MPDPRSTIRAWLPHLALLGLCLVAFAWLWTVIAPARNALLLAGSLALLTHPVLCAPIERRLRPLGERLGWSDDWRRAMAAALATAAVLAALVLPLLLLLWSALGSLGGTASAIFGILMRDPDQVAAVSNGMAQRAAALATLYPDLGLDPAHVAGIVREALAETAIGPAFLRELISGTGGLLAQGALAVVTLFYCYAAGARLASALLSPLPLDAAARERLARRFHHTAAHLLVGVGGRALAHGLVLGLLAWWIGSFPFILIVAAATMVCLLPLVGPAVAWMPLALLLWRGDHHLDAACFGVAALAGAFLVEHGARRFAAWLGTDALWLGFLLFLCLVGGVLGYGLLGLLLGPAALLCTVTLARVVPELYGRTADEG